MNAQITGGIPSIDGGQSPDRSPALSEAVRDRSGPRCFGPPLLVP